MQVSFKAIIWLIRSLRYVGIVLDGCYVAKLLILLLLRVGRVGVGKWVLRGLFSL